MKETRCCFLRVAADENDNDDGRAKGPSLLHVAVHMEDDWFIAKDDGHDNDDDLDRKPQGNGTKTTPFAFLLPASLVIVLVVLLFLFVSFGGMMERFNTTWNQDKDSHTAAALSFLTADEYGLELLGGTTTVVHDGEACYTALDCDAGRWCAFPSMQNMSIRICCAEALRLGGFDKDIVNDPDSLWLTVCTGAAVDEPCASHHDLCASGYCVHGKCRAQGLPAGHKCTDHGACATGACGRWYAYKDNRNNNNNTTRLGGGGGGGSAQQQQQRCCPTARFHTQHDMDNVPYPLHFCHGTATQGQPCGGHKDLCREGLICDATQNDTCQVRGDSL